MSWQYVTRHLGALQRNLDLTASQNQAVVRHAHSIGRSLWQHYYVGEYNPIVTRIVGSHGKGIANRPMNDVDILFVLPDSEFGRIQAIRHNPQSYLLQEVAAPLLETFRNTASAADGQVVVVPFQDVKVEVVPAFSLGERGYLVCHTPDGGSWRHSNPTEEARNIKRADQLYGGKATPLIRMAKAWKRECNVPIKSLALEVLAVLFLDQWHNRYRDYGLFWSDWMIRDFFSYLLQYGTGSGWIRVPGTSEIVELGDKWVSRTATALSRAVKACNYECEDDDSFAESEWAKIFGVQAYTGIRSIYHLGAY